MFFPSQYIQNATESEFRYREHPKFGTESNNASPESSSEMLVFGESQKIGQESTVQIVKNYWQGSKEYLRIRDLLFAPIFGEFHGRVPLSYSWGTWGGGAVISGLLDHHCPLQILNSLHKAIRL